MQKQTIAARITVAALVLTPTLTPLVSSTLPVNAVQVEQTVQAEQTEHSSQLESKRNSAYDILKTLPKELHSIKLAKDRQWKKTYTRFSRKAHEILTTAQERHDAEQTELVSLGNFKVTAYCPCEKCCDQNTTTSCGTKPHVGIIATDRSVIPMGSVVEIDGIKYVAEDTGGAIDGNRIDIFYNTHQEALEYGVQEHEVFLVTHTETK